MKKILVLLLAVAGCVKMLPQGTMGSKKMLSDYEEKSVQYAAANGYDHISNKTNIDLIAALPAELGGFENEMGLFMNYETKVHGGGYGRKYNRGDSIWTDVYFYHARKTGLKDGIDSKELADEFDAVKSEIAAAYADIEKQKESVATYGGIRFRRYQFSGLNGGRARNSEMFLTIYHGTFLKIRASYFSEPDDGAREIDEFMKALVQNLEKK